MALAICHANALKYMNNMACKKTDKTTAEDSLLARLKVPHTVFTTLFCKTILKICDLLILKALVEIYFVMSTRNETNNKYL